MIPERTSDRLKALVLVLMAIFFAEKLASGRLYFYIGPRFAWLSVLAVALFIMLAGAYNLVGKQKANSHSEQLVHEHNHLPAEGGMVSVWPLVIVALPLALGTLIPPRPLGASAISSRGVTTDMAVTTGTAPTRLTVIPGERNVLDWVRAMSENPDPAALNGQKADVIGFVYRDARFAEDQFMIARFTITCCIADALAVGLVVQDANARQYPADSWVRVQGTFGQGSLAGNPIPILMAEQITPVQPPEQPYLYP
jgi:uncharacterized repeat protein (TIGR03943 family)